MKEFWLGVAGIFLVILLGWIFTGNSLLMNKFFSPKQEQVRREVFEETKSYNQGMIQELQNMQFEYIKAKPEQQAALRSIILHRSADYPTDKMPIDLYNFIQELKR
jgi:hypothetical protein